MENPAVEKYNVLYIGGDTNVINELKKQNEQFSVSVVENGLAAINFLNNNPDVDAILSEDNLPGMNGIGLCRMIRQKHILPQTPFIIISHEKKSDLIHQAMKEKIDDVYFTPLDLNKLYIRISFLRKFKIQFKQSYKSTEPVKEYKMPLIKRAFDILVSGVALILISPLLLLITLAVKLESKGPVFYTSKRVGTGYKIFDFYKFRSMYTGADAELKELEHLNKYAARKEEKEEEKKESIQKETSPQECPRCAKLAEGEYCSPTLYTGGEKICEYWYNKLKKEKAQSTFVKITNDPRITKVGKIIRNTSIDELPQLFNVLKGDMSIVGNRPLPLYEAELLTSDDWSERFLGPAGITGLWQVELRGKKGEMSEEERKALDNQYARTYSFWGDIKLILRTIPALLQKENA